MEEFNAEVKIEAILNWAEEECDTFDTDFVESLKGRIENGDDLTPKQEAAIDRIIEDWEIDVEHWSEM